MIRKTVSHYKILEKLGEGGMGEVYKAEDTKLIRFVALKFLLKQLTQSEKACQRFRNEARMVAPLDHPNICTVHELNKTDDGQLYFVMGFCEGETLQQKIENKKLKLRKVLDYAIQTAQGLSEAHNQGITHRDIKASNLMVTPKGVVKILDFGISKVDRFDMHTRTGAVFGSLGYMSPEQSTGKTLDHRTDIWSFGVVLYQAFSGRMPFQGENDGVILNGILNEQPPALRELVPNIPIVLEHIVEKAMAKNPDDRYTNIDEMLLDLQNATRQIFRTAVSREDRNKKRKMNRVHLVGGAGILIVIILLIGLWFNKNEVVVPVEKPITLAVADFQNFTAEEELSSLSGMLITVLERSPRLSVLTRSRMYDLMKQLDIDDLPNIGRIDERLASEICVYADIHALAIPTIRRFDNLYTIDLKVVDPVSDAHLFVAEARGENKTSIPQMLDRLYSETHDGLKIERTDEPEDLWKRTSIEAYDHYFKGADFWYKLQDEKAEEELGKAIAIDSTFGLPYALLVSIYIGTQRDDLAREPLQKAMRFKSQFPERERLLIEGINAYVEEGAEAAIEKFKRIEPRYPDDKRVYLGLGWFCRELESFEEADRYLKMALALDPFFEIARNLLSDDAKK